MAAAVLALHLAWILWVVFGALWTKDRPFWTAFHVASLVWGIVVELSPLPCPLTLLENFCEAKAGIQPYTGGFLLHYLDRLVYPDLPESLLVCLGVAICAVNLIIYLRRYWRIWRSPPRRNAHN